MKIICYGDSNTYGYDPRPAFGGRYPADSRWVDILEEETGWEFMNVGQNGREIPRREFQMNAVNDLVTKHAPDLLTVMLGSNDLLMGASAERAATRLETFLTQLPFPMERVLVITPPPAKPGTWVTDERLLVTSAQLADSYRRLADRLGAHFADAAEWGISLSSDGVHFTPEGHRAFAAGLYEKMTRVLTEETNGERKRKMPGARSGEHD